jgi:T-complex protein 1 subunit theta
MANLGAMPGYGIQSMLKEGHRHLSGLQEAVLKNIDACREVAAITRTSYGPNGEGVLPLLPLF